MAPSNRRWPPLSAAVRHRQPEATRSVRQRREAEEGRVHRVPPPFETECPEAFVTRSFSKRKSPPPLFTINAKFTFKILRPGHVHPLCSSSLCGTVLA